MPHPLKLKIGALRRRARQLLVAHGLACATAVAAAVVMLAALGDYYFRYEETGIRVASTLAVALVVGWCVWRYLIPAVRFPLDDIFLARRVEQKFPELHERLAGAVAFLKIPDDALRAGSIQLRKTVIHETTQDALPLPFGTVFRRKPIVYAVGSAVFVCIAAAALWATHPELARIASLRLLNPWGDDAWPQTNHLKVVDPVEQVAFGHRFRVDVVDEHDADVEGDVVVFFRRLNDDSSAAERVVMRPDGRGWTAERAKSTYDFAYRAVGGDDRSMSWREVRVVEAPELQQVRWKVNYPPYARWNAFDTGPKPADQVLLSAPVPAGSTLEVWARSNKPLRSAQLKIDGAEPLTAKLDDDKRGFSLTSAGGNTWQVAKSQSYRWELVGDDGFIGGDEFRREISVEPDPAPWVKLPKPIAAPEDPRGDVYVTPEAVVAVQVHAGDAFAVRPGIALREIVLRYNRSDESDEPDRTIALHAGPAKLEPAEADAPPHLREEETRTIDYSWDLKPLALKPGTVLTLFAAASDYQPQERTSDSRRLRIVGSDEFLERLNERQRALHAELNKLRTKQAAALDQVEKAAKQFRPDTPPADDKQAEERRRALIDAVGLQRDIATGLGLRRDDKGRQIDRPENALPESDAGMPPIAQPESFRREGIEGRVASMLEDLKANRIDNREVEGRLNDIAAELARVDREAKPQEITDRLSQALKTDAGNEAQRKETAEALADAGENQRKLADALDEMLRNLAQWDDYGKFHEELARMKREQEQVAAETLEHMKKQMTAAGRDDETAQQRNEADARRRDEIAAKQAAIARRMEQLQQAMRRNREAGEQVGTDALDRALQAAELANPSASMRDAGEMLRNDQLGKAPQKQQEALSKLGQVMQALSAQKLDELNRLVSKLKAAESELEKLSQEQKSLKSKFREAEKMTNEAERKRQLQRLAKQQRELQKKTAQLAEQLQRLKAQRSANRMQQGGGRMAGAGQAGEQGEAEAAGDQAEAAERDLENAQRELAEERKRAENDLANEAAVRLQDDIKALIARQRRVVDETKRYEALRQAGGLTRAAQIGVLDLADEQDALKQETTSTAERLGSSAAFKLALEGAAGDMGRTSQALRERRTDERTQRTAENAVRRFQQLLDALQPRKPKQGQAGQEGAEGGDSGGQQGGGEERPTSIAELVLIKLMQEGVNARTRELDDLRKRTRLTPEEAAEYQHLGEEQGKLADLLIDLVGEEDAADERTSSDLDLKDLDLDAKPDQKAEPPAMRPSPANIPTGATIGETE